MTIVAITRPVPISLSRCELTHVERLEIDIAKAVAEHDGYEAALRALGCTITSLAPAPELPDSVFVEDAAVVLDEVAIVGRPGAESRRDEIPAVAEALGRYRRVVTVKAPGTLDGGDVMRADRSIYIGISTRTNVEGIRQFADAVAPFGYAVQPVVVRDCLHLKSAVTAPADDLLLLNPAWVDGHEFGGLPWVEVDPREPFAANVLRVRDTLLCAAASPHTRARLEARGFNVRAVEVSELAKAEAGVTCCSLIVTI